MDDEAEIVRAAAGRIISWGTRSGFSPKDDSFHLQPVTSHQYDDTAFLTWQFIFFALIMSPEISKPYNCLKANVARFLRFPQIVKSSVLQYQLGHVDNTPGKAYWRAVYLRPKIAPKENIH